MNGACLSWTQMNCLDGERCISNACTAACPLQSAANLVPNGGFDQGLGGWEGGALALDAAECPQSYAVECSAASGPQLLSPCFAVPIGDDSEYKFGGYFRELSCQIDFASDPGCRQEILGEDRLAISWPQGTTGWQRYQVMGRIPVGAKSARIDCIRAARFVPGYADRLYLRKGTEGGF